ncbi:MAG: PEP-CTERM sorting domain-containing protein [Thiohalocapsa sp. PB-PSB1]|nr:MAG: PEP-CTERM sorting domain-containing protein [Thiohalocapsa sp. PB-PSB1]
MLTAAPTYSAIIRWDFTSTIYLVNTPLDSESGIPSVGETISGYLIFDSSSLDQRPAASEGEYDIISIYASTASHEWTSHGLSAINAYNDYPGYIGHDVYDLWSRANGPDFGNWSLQRISINYRDLDSTMLADDRLLLEPPDLNDPQIANFEIMYGDNPDMIGHIRHIAARLDNVTASTVPLPNTLLIIGLGLAAIMSKRLVDRSRKGTTKKRFGLSNSIA